MPEVQSFNVAPGSLEEGGKEEKAAVYCRSQEERKEQDPKIYLVFFVLDPVIVNRLFPEHSDGFKPGRPLGSVSEFVLEQTSFKTSLGGLSHIVPTLLAL